MITRADYLAGKVTHEVYYRAVNQTAGLNWENAAILGRVKACLRDGDEHLNKIPLAWWDRQGTNPWLRANLGRAFKVHEDHLSLAGIVCCLKQAAKDAITKE